MSSQAEVVVDLAARVKNLELWRKDQGEAVVRVEAKVDRLLMWMMTAAFTTLGTLVVGLLVLYAQKR